MPYPKLKATRGFTLIELLVVISIISLLASIVLTSLSGARIKAQDTKRISQLKEIQKAMELYATSNNNLYPDIPGLACFTKLGECGGFEGTADTNFLQPYISDISKMVKAEQMISNIALAASGDPISTLFIATFNDRKDYKISMTNFKNPQNIPPSMRDPACPGMGVASVASSEMIRNISLPCEGIPE